MTVATVFALILHLPFTPAMPLLRTLHRLAILKEPPKEEEVPNNIELPIELVEPPKPEPTSKEDNSVALPTEPPKEQKEKAARKAEAERKKLEEEQKKAEDARKKAEELARKKAEATRPNDPKKVAQAEANNPPEDKEAGKFAQGGEDNQDDENAPAEPRSTNSKDRVPKKADAVGLKGKLDERVKGKPAVSMALWLSGVRAHPMASAVGGLMACNPEWKPFLQKGVNPIEDLEGFLMVGPQITSSKHATVAVQHRVDSTRVNEVLGALIQRSGAAGKWLQEGVARVMIQRSERVMFTHPDSMLFIAPPANWRDIHALPDPISLPESKGRTLGLTLQKPAKVLKRFAVDVPSSLTELRLDLYANQDGSVDVQLDLIDTSATAAGNHATELNRSLKQLVSDLSQIAQTAASLAPEEIAGELKGEDLKLPLPEVSVVGERLTTTLRLSAAQTGKLLGLFSKATCKKKAASPKRP